MASDRLVPDQPERKTAFVILRSLTASEKVSMSRFTKFAALALLVGAGFVTVTALPLDYASGRHPQFSATLMPGLVKNHEHAKRLNSLMALADWLNRLLKKSFSVSLRAQRSNLLVGGSMTWRLLRRLRLLAKTAFRTFSAAC